MISRKTNLAKVFVLVFVLGLIFSCATTMDQKITYLTARDTFNTSLKNYSERVAAMPAGAQKDEVKAQFNPIWKDADTALDTWGDIVKGGSTDDPMEAIRLYTQAKNRLIELGLKYFGDKLFVE